MGDPCERHHAMVSRVSSSSPHPQLRFRKQRNLLSPWADHQRFEGANSLSWFAIDVFLRDLLESVGKNLVPVMTEQRQMDGERQLEQKWAL